MPDKVWRACREVLPKSGLSKRGVDVVDECPLGCSEEESVLHALVGCPLLREFWNKTVIPFTDQFDPKLPFIEWLNCALPEWDAEMLNLFAVCAYNLWHHRNEIRVDSRTMSLDQVWEKSSSLIKELKLILTSSSEALRVQRPPVRWILPPHPFYKLNVDASLQQGIKGGVGCVVRDCSGRVLAALAKRIDHVHDVELLEATAAQDGFSF
ncbi:TMV resistance protein N-like [Senna tora]|uniref:TMV resistance protein N-like n=1 Tax=Senna tora TaxID=362788 RepID=A0A834WD60_9FABA|nr:TMV resistance protein N-like [Senna tora]